MRWSFEELRRAVASGYLDRRTATTAVEETPPETPAESEASRHDLHLVDPSEEDDEEPAAAG